MYTDQSWDVAKLMSKQKPTHLNSLIDALDSRLNSQEPANRSLVSLLNSLAAHLEMHFELERPEQDKSLIVNHNVKYSDALHSLELERTELLSEVEEMIAMARLAFIHKQSTEPLAVRYRAFQDRFARHEAAEKKLIQDVLSADPSMAE